MTFLLPRLFVPASATVGAWSAGSLLRTPTSALQHLATSLRLEAGAQLRAFNASQGEWLCRVSSSRCEQLQLLRPLRPPLEERALDACGPFVLHGVEGREASRFLYERCTEAGAGGFIPIVCERSQQRSGAGAGAGLQQKAAAWVVGAAEQSERLHIPRVLPPMPLEEAIRLWRSGGLAGGEPLMPERRTRLPWLYLLDEASAMARRRDGHGHALGAPFAGALPRAPHGPEGEEGVATVIVGPAGGWAPRERQLFSKLAEEGQLRSLHVSSNVLRAETAALAACLALTNRPKQERCL